MSDFFAPASSQFDLAATTLTDLYTCPDNKTVKLSVTFCNRAVTDTAIRCAIARAGEADDPKQYIMYDELLEANTSYFIESISLNEGDIIRVEAADADVSVGAYVEEVRELAP